MNDSLISNLRTEADLCRNETADAIAALLDSAADELTRLYAVEFAAKRICADYQANSFSHDNMITMIESLRINAPVVDICTDPENCKRCKAHAWEKRFYSHAGKRVR